MSVPGIEEFSLGNGAIVHNCSHPADAFRMLAIAWRSEPRVRQPDVSKPLMVGAENTATLNDVWAQANQPKRGRI
jgi:hypothetical protein